MGENTSKTPKKPENKLTLCKKTQTKPKLAVASTLVRTAHMRVIMTV